MATTEHTTNWIEAPEEIVGLIGNAVDGDTSRQIEEQIVDEYIARDAQGKLTGQRNQPMTDEFLVRSIVRRVWEVKKSKGDL